MRRSSRRASRALKARTYAASRSINACLEARLRSARMRSEEHTSELQSHSDLVCRLLLEKKKGRSDLNSVRQESFKRDQLLARVGRNAGRAMVHGGVGDIDAGGYFLDGLGLAMSRKSRTG